MKTKEELFALRNEVELLNTKLCELSDDELAQVTGGIAYRAYCGVIKTYGYDPSMLYSAGMKPGDIEGLGVCLD